MVDYNLTQAQYREVLRAERKVAKEAALVKKHCSRAARSMRKSKSSDVRRANASILGGKTCKGKKK